MYRIEIFLPVRKNTHTGIVEGDRGREVYGRGKKRGREVYGRGEERGREVYGSGAKRGREG